MHDGSMDSSLYGGEYRPIYMSIQSTWHYYDVQKQLQLYMEELTVLLHFDEISAIWWKCELLENLSKVFFAFLFFLSKAGLFKWDPDKDRVFP